MASMLKLGGSSSVHSISSRGTMAIARVVVAATVRDERAARRATAEEEMDNIAIMKGLVVVMGGV